MIPWNYANDKKDYSYQHTILLLPIFFRLIFANFICIFYSCFIFFYSIFITLISKAKCYISVQKVGETWSLHFFQDIISRQLCTSLIFEECGQHSWSLLSCKIKWYYRPYHNTFIVLSSITEKHLKFFFKSEGQQTFSLLALLHVPVHVPLIIKAHNEY